MELRFNVWRYRTHCATRHRMRAQGRACLAGTEDPRRVRAENIAVTRGGFRNTPAARVCCTGHESNDLCEVR
ncbi:hypothetical protein ACFFX0_08555 [Citricoccus parietis]|uniref:Uncharacterized protein n=1 Tax=Citricoccus parietis TaxID=592307 RepID=A0ABV5FX38_9MICC